MKFNDYGLTRSQVNFEEANKEVKIYTVLIP